MQYRGVGFFTVKNYKIFFLLFFFLFREELPTNIGEETS